MIERSVGPAHMLGDFFLVEGDEVVMQLLWQGCQI